MIDAVISESAELLARIFPGESELAARMRAYDWGSTELGSPSTWPENLRVALGICLTSKFPMYLLWGASLTLFYNDAYVSLLGPGKHPTVLGRSGREAWAEVWHTIGPMIDAVRATKQASWSADLRMFFERALPKEEVYLTFSLSPVFGASGVDGLFCACTESTQKIVATRRLEALRLLCMRATAAQTIDGACNTSADVLANHACDVPFAAIYAIDDSGVALLRASTGLPSDHSLPRSIALEEHAEATWPIAAVARHQRPHVVHDLPALGLSVPAAAPWPELTRSAVVLPIPSSAPDKPAGVLVAGVSPRLVFEAEYQSFFERVAGHIGTGIAEAQAYDAERKRADMLAELDRSKTAFFTNVSHEFRTPLTLILGPLEDALVQLRNGSPEELAPQLETVRRNAFRLLRLVNTLLDFSRIEAGRMRACFEPTDLGKTTIELASTFRSVVERAGLKLTTRSDVIEAPLFVDRTMYEMIVLNLLSNAFKFTLAGAIDVSLRSTVTGVELTIADTGVGIAKDQLPHVFERFRRIEDTRARTYEGTGIGLALVRELVGLHCGEISIESELGRGTRVTVAFRNGSAHLAQDWIAQPQTSSSLDSVVGFVEDAARWVPQPTAALDALDAVAAGASPRARILVVDDNADVRSYVMRVLSEHWTVTAAENGYAALDALRKAKFDLVLTDVMMPECDGFELIRTLRADAQLAALPVVVVTGRAGEEARLEGLEHGADDYLTKPFSARELVARVATHLSLTALRGDILSSRAKGEFLSVLSHELRNPLAPITTAVSLMRMSGSESHELDVIERQTQHLRHLVDDLLDVAGIEAGKVELNREFVELGSVVASAIELARSQVEARHQVLKVEVPPLGLGVIADPSRLAQVLSNLIVNAAKYSAPGSAIEIEGEAVDGSARIVVRDRGIGLAPEMRSRVFNMFVQQSQALDRKLGGLGLGLAIARGLVELHGGSLRAVSDGVGRGAELIVELPLAEPWPPGWAKELAADSGTFKSAGHETHRVLVVDDNTDSADLLASALTRFGYSVATAYDGVDGLSTAGAFQPDVCLLDIGLPLMDGYELARQLRDPAKFPSGLRLIAITGYGQAADRQRAAEAGFDAHLTKPVDLENLLGLLEPGVHGVIT
ncbi:MAG TPA: response regulator [Polyangiales bacterium]|nr:response regulator [Polyangiales bacterium]